MTLYLQNFYFREVKFNYNDLQILASWSCQQIYKTIIFFIMSHYRCYNIKFITENNLNKYFNYVNQFKIAFT